jgi:HAD superfamily hydrolase (TIGR01458 family)
MARVRGVLLDLGGVVFVGDEPIDGAIDSIATLKAAGVAVRFLTNTTRRPLRVLVAKLRRLGIETSAEEVFTPAMAARHVLAGRVPHLLVHPDLLEDFDRIPDAPPQVVVVGDAGDGFSYQALNTAFRVLDGGADLLALARNRAFEDDDGALSLDAGPFVTALEFASGRDAVVIGKPAGAFFAAALASLGVGADEALMVGDDVESDVGGAMAAGLRGILVRTGKYRQGDETKIDPSPTVVADDLAAAVTWLLGAT